MSILSLLSFFAFVVYLYLGIYALRLDPRSKLNRTFFVLILSYVVWAFAYTFFYSAPDEATCWFWYRVSTVGWCLFPGIALHFFMILTGKEDLLRRWWIYPLLYLPGISFLFKALTGTLLVTGFVRQGLGWCEVAPQGSAWFWSYVAYYSSFILAGLIMIYRWGGRSESLKRRKQGKVILMTAFPILILSAVTDSLLPALGVHLIPSVAVILILGWVFGIWYAIVKYKLMILTPSIAADEIITRMVDLLLLVNPDGRIIRVNRRVTELLGHEEDELVGLPVSAIIREEACIGSHLEQMMRRPHSTVSCNLGFVAKSGEDLPAHISCSAMLDGEGDVIGMVIVGQDIRQLKQLNREIEERKRAEETLLSAEAKFRSLVEQSLVGIYIIQDDRFSYVNPKFAEIFGHDQGELLSSKKVPDLVTPESLPLVRENIRRRMEGKVNSLHYTFKGRRKDGSVIDVEVHGSRTEFNGRPAIIGALLDITERTMMEETIRHQALHDALTGLPNRTLYNDRLRLALAQARRAHGKLAVLFLDLDYFKSINDSLGHAMGDRLLQSAASILSGCLREGDTVARMGGDEYTILLTQIRHEDEAAKVAQKILAAFEKPLPLDGRIVRITTSIGISIYPRDGTEPDTLLRNADAAMYHAKGKGKNRYEFYDSSIASEVSAPLGIGNTGGQQAVLRTPPQT